MPRMVTPKALTATGAIKAGPGYVHAITLAAGSDAATVTLDDSTAGGGTDVYVLAAAATDGNSVTFPVPIYFAVGIYATLTGTGPAVSVAYE